MNYIKGGLYMKVKIFANVGDAPKLEGEINKWLLENNKVDIIHIKQNYAYDNKNYFYTLISIWYKEKNGNVSQN